MIQSQSNPAPQEISEEAYRQLLSNASQEPDFVHLGSVGNGENRGSVAGFSALAVQTLNKTFKQDSPVSSDSIEPIIEASAQRFAVDKEDSPEHLIGGWVGFISYEFGYEIEPRLRPLRRALPAPLFSAGLYLWMASFNRDSGLYYLWMHPELDEQTRSTIERWLETSPREHQNTWKTLSPFQPRQSQSEFERSVERVRAYIHEGDCYQANLSQEFSAPFSGDPWQAFEALSEHNPTPHSAFIRAGSTAVMSVSPERFLTIRDNIVTTSPIKGTRKRGDSVSTDRDLANELQESEKDRAENLMIVDLLRNDLSRNAENGSVQVDELFALETYRNVHHLVSHIRCRLAPGITPTRALLDAFPGGSITGAPKIRAMEIIRELEPHDRGPYCGSIFFRSLDGSLESNIAIRTLYCDHEGQVHCCGGGGIVADSDPESEYQETLTKVKSLMDFLEQFGGRS